MMDGGEIQQGGMDSEVPIGTAEQEVQNEELAAKAEIEKRATVAITLYEGDTQRSNAEASQAEGAGAGKTEEGKEVGTGEKRAREDLGNKSQDIEGGENEVEKNQEQEGSENAVDKETKKPRLSVGEAPEGGGGPSTEKKTKGRQRKTSTKAKATEPKKRAGRPKKSAAVVHKGGAVGEGEAQEHQQEINIASEDAPAGHTRSRS